ncbi:hypothetical protein HZB60_12620 [candidate division KSB1 bacterium]|nr:hypothetical protein [candidate division KSB1 bacterium]
MRVFKLILCMVLGGLALGRSGIAQPLDPQRALGITITAVETDSFPRMKLRAQVARSDTAVLNLPITAFTLREDGREMALLSYCFANETRPVDMVFVMDLSRSMDALILRVDSTIEGLVDSLPTPIDAKFGLVRYGQSNSGSLNTPPGYTRFPGSPIHENTAELYTANRFRQRLDTLTQVLMSGGQEPAYQAILAALRMTAWRPNSERFIILVADENNDSCRTLPFINVNLLRTEMTAYGAKFLSWCNYNSMCDCYDRCPQSGRCDTLVQGGCLSGYDHFAPLAIASRGATVPIQNDFLDLWGVVRFNLFSTYFLCYDSPLCCENGLVHNLYAEVTNLGETASDVDTFSLHTCPTFAWSPETLELMEGPCRPAYAALPICATMLQEGNPYPGGLAYLLYRRAGQDSFFPTAMEPDPLHPGSWCGTVPADSAIGPFVQFYVSMINPYGMSIYFPCDTAQICVDEPPYVTCDIPPRFACEEMTVSVNAWENDGTLISTDICWGIPQQGFDTCFTPVGAPPWSFTVPASRLGFDSLCVRATTLDDQGLTASCATCRTPTPHFPIVEHNPVTERFACDSFAVCATATDMRNDVAAWFATWVCDTDTVIAAMLPQPLIPTVFCATLPAEFVNATCDVRYVIEARDACGYAGFSGWHTTPWVQHCPQIVMDTVRAAAGCAPITFCANVTDAKDDVSGVFLDYRCVGDTTFASLPMAIVPFAGWCVTLPGDRPNPMCNLEYQVRATDACGCTTTNGTHTIAVTTTPPEIVHTPVPTRFDCRTVEICAVIDAGQGGLAAALISFVCPGGDTLSVPLTPQVLPPNTYCATIPQSLVEIQPSCVIDYQISAVNSCGAGASTGWYPIGIAPHCPVIVHDTLRTASACAAISLCVGVEDEVGDVAAVVLDYRCAGDETFATVPLVFVPLVGWCGTIPYPRTNPTCDIEYQIRAEDECGCGATNGPHPVALTTTTPTITHTPVETRFDCRTVELCAWIGAGQGSLIAHDISFACPGTDTITVPMVPQLAPGVFCATIPQPLVDIRPSCVVSYRIQAVNDCGVDSAVGWYAVAIAPHCPEIVHDTLRTVEACAAIPLCIAVNDAVGDVSSVLLDYRCAGEADFSTVPLVLVPLVGWCGTIPGERANPTCNLEYQIRAQDSCGCSTTNGVHFVTVTTTPPTITHTPVEQRFDCQNVDICALIGAGQGTLAAQEISFYCPSGDTITVPLTAQLTPGLFCANLPQSLVDIRPGCVVNYRIRATNFCGVSSEVGWYPIAVVPHCPQIEHIPITSAGGCSEIRICAGLADAAADLDSAVVDYRCAGDTTFTTLPLVLIPPEGWCATIPAGRPNGYCNLEYQIRAGDACGCDTSTGLLTIEVSTLPPTITHTPVSARYDCQNTSICALIGAGMGHATATAHFFCDAGDTLHVPMIEDLVPGVYCVQIPQALIDIRPSCVVHYQISAINSCGLTAETIWYEIGITPHCPVISYTPVLAAQGCQDITVCASSVFDAGGDLNGVLLDYRCSGAEDSATLPMEFTPLGEWCAVIPATRPDATCDIAYRIRATDACGCVTLTAPDTIRIQVTPPTIEHTLITSRPDCGNAQICALIGAGQSGLASVMSSFYCAGGDTITVPMTPQLVPGVYCAILPQELVDIRPSCEIYYRMRATNLCGAVSVTEWYAIEVLPHCPVITHVPVATAYACAAIEICADVADSLNDLSTVTLDWWCAGDESNSVSLPMPAGAAGYCATIPANRPDATCTLEYRIVSRDSCGCERTDGVHLITLGQRPPHIIHTPLTQRQDCFGGTVCATIVDTFSAITSVVGSFTCGPDTLRIPAAVAGGDYCADIPPSLIDIRPSCEIRYMVQAVNACGATAITEWFPIQAVPHCPVVVHTPVTAVDACSPVTICANITDAGGDLSTAMLFWECEDGSYADSSSLIPVGQTYCLQLPAARPNATCNLRYRIVATDQCECSVTDGWWTVLVNPVYPVVQCATANADSVDPGDSFTVCAEISDPFGIQAVQLVFPNGECSGPRSPVDQGNGFWCVELDQADCLQNAGQIVYRFDVTNSCGFSASTPCTTYVRLPDRADLGDLPTPPYSTRDRLSGGPAHLLSGVCWLGATITAEDLPYATVDGDDSDDGFLAECETQVWGNCNEVSFGVTVTTGPNYRGQPMFVSGWIDMDGNGSFHDLLTCADGSSVSEWFVTNEVVTAGLNFLVAHVQNAIPNGALHIRLRLSTTPFTADDDVDPIGSPRLDGEVEDYRLQCSNDECCYLCEAPQVTLFEPVMLSPQGGIELVAQFGSDRLLHLAWADVPNAQYYQVYRGSFDDPLDPMEMVTTVLAPVSEWTDTTAVSLLQARRFYQVAAHGLTSRPAVLNSDCARWEMNENGGGATFDQTGHGHDATRVEPCPPPWGLEADPDCYHSTGSLHFPGYVGEFENRCASHLEVVNDNAFYESEFQIWTRIRLSQEPTEETGPFYLISNNSFDALHGGFAVRIEPAYITLPNGTRVYHNQLAAFVWNRSLNGGYGDWMVLRSPWPTAGDPTYYSVPVGEWSCVCVVVNGTNSALIIDGRIVAAGRLDLISDNNGAPLIIGAGYRHSTYPIEYPFFGDMDCMRITCDLE